MFKIRQENLKNFYYNNIDETSIISTKKADNI